VEFQEGNDDDDSDSDPPEGFWNEKSYRQDEERWAKDEEQWAMEEKSGSLKIDTEWFAPSDDYWDLANQIDGLGKDVFDWLYRFAHNPTSPADYCVCHFHKHSSEPCGDMEKFPTMKESCGYPKIIMDYKKCNNGLTRLPDEDDD
jgi:hypothetical protein